jgi:hypothetical protein
MSAATNNSAIWLTDERRATAEERGHNAPAEAVHNIHAVRVGDDMAAIGL